ncbi:aminodeoxychorismate synthase component I [Aquibacillus halophilus]|uniref:Aminodeoxychorismate synthase component I n=1 Tax=Aquibacillus halophilus TaxID=930132 RepID=A0A6A8DE95_9BACI|nr:aminodeoxychorismate synthase component I [Aquibacillus halophilus]MRH42101.1 aminodeoxychorismate synthase component I [Aquibacillus halophilus]
MNPYLLFEFANEAGITSPKLFTRPIEILETNKHEEVATIFEKVEHALDSGYYVAGYLSYEAAPAFDPNYKIHNNSTLPLVWFATFENFIDETVFPANQDYSVSNWHLASTYRDYQTGIKNIKQAIEDGNTYQVNYTARLHAKFFGSDQSFYHQLARNQRASYSAYLNTGRYSILSASPELFFRVSGNKITTKPMKGTAKRGRTTKEDQQLIYHLKNSEKEQAENLMIVDLLRNDIGRISKTGSVQVPKLFDIETYPTVHQMTTTIEAELEENTTVFDWFSALFPCGSITGAPKISTMSYIASLEQSPREVYCGAVGYITPKREAIFNVPIRTVVIDSDMGTATYGVGGGITWDSTVEGEYDELLTKAKLLTEQRQDFKLLESLRLENGEFPLLSYHLNRLEDSAEYFQFKIDRVNVIEKLQAYARDHTKENYKLRLLVDELGEIKLDGRIIYPIKEPINCKLAPFAIDVQNPYVFHKTTRRDHYTILENDNSNIFTTLLWNKDEELTEFTIGNLVLKIDDEYYTPPINSGLLAGTFRQHLLDKAIIEEKVLKKTDLQRADEIWFINSVRGWLKVNLITNEEEL